MHYYVIGWYTDHWDHPSSLAIHRAGYTDINAAYRACRLVAVGPYAKQYIVVEYNTNLTTLPPPKL